VEATTPHDKPVRTNIALKELGVLEWTEGQRPVWVQLALPRLEEPEQELFEGSANPWSQTRAPGIDWTAVDRVLERAGLAPSSLDVHERRLLRSLPFAYGRGVARVAREVWGRQPRGHLRYFPSIAFRPVETDDENAPPAFWTVRMTVGVIRNVVVTVRLPDLWWNSETEEFDYEPGERLEVNERFFPEVDDLTADDVAEAIALQGASTARAVTYKVRTELTTIERKWRKHVASVKQSNRDEASADIQKVIEMTDSTYQLDRQIERLLRRIEPTAAGQADHTTVSEIALRYRFALDELRSLEGNCRLASEALRHAITTGEQEDRERFHFVAALLASAILIPTLVAGVYGANVRVPAQNTEPGFKALLLFIVASAILGPCLIAVWARHKWVKKIRVPGIVVGLTAAILFAVTCTLGVVQIA
jgi:Mg2+ and Co2+ transporter CorA